ncbi:hypothetical protein CBS101457_000214 [Exobasidium rhododendri]|nr:hypothetical protein CBS101457_000214 [Exobasidium rhododendri]
MTNHRGTVIALFVSLYLCGVSDASSWPVNSVWNDRDSSIEHRHGQTPSFQSHTHQPRQSSPPDYSVAHSGHSQDWLQRMAPLLDSTDDEVFRSRSHSPAAFTYNPLPEQETSSRDEQQSHVGGGDTQHNHYSPPYEQTRGESSSVWYNDLEDLSSVSSNHFSRPISSLWRGTQSGSSIDIYGHHAAPDMWYNGAYSPLDIEFHTLDDTSHHRLTTGDEQDVRPEHDQRQEHRQHQEPPKTPQKGRRKSKRPSSVDQRTDTVLHGSPVWPDMLLNDGQVPAVNTTYATTHRDSSSAGNGSAPHPVISHATPPSGKRPVYPSLLDYQKSLELQGFTPYLDAENRYTDHFVIPWEFTVPIDASMPAVEDDVAVFDLLTENQRTLILDRIVQIRPYVEDSLRKKLRNNMDVAMASDLLSTDDNVVAAAINKLYPINERKRGSKEDHWMTDLTNTERKEVIAKFADATEQRADELRSLFLRRKLTPRIAKDILHATSKEQCMQIAVQHQLILPVSEVPTKPWQKGASNSQRKALIYRMLLNGVPSNIRCYKLLEKTHVPSGFGLKMLRANDEDFKTILLWLSKKARYIPPHLLQ